MKPKLTGEQIQEACKLYIEEGVSAVKLAKQFNCGASTMTSWLKKNGVEIRDKSVSISMHWVEFKQEDRYQEYIKGVSERTKGPKSKEARENMSKARADGIANGTINHRTYGKSQWYKGLYCRSTYEVRFVDICEEYGIPIEACRIVIPYEYKGFIRNYVPDFINQRDRVIYEVKPLKLKGSKTNQAKARAAHDWGKENGYRYQFITEVTLYGEDVSRESYSD